VGGYSTDNYTRYAVDFINRKHDRPWFLWLCYGAVHGPYTAAPRHESEYGERAPVPTPVDVFPPRPGKPKYAREFGVWERGPGGEPMLEGRALAEWVRQYNRGVLAIDEGVGQVVKALEQSGQLDNTFVVFVSDQGFAWGQHGFRHKLAPYDANLRVPFIVRAPGHAAEGKTCLQPVAALDLIPTIFALAQTPVPWAMHGHDLSSILKEPASAWPHPVMLENFRWEFGEETDRAVADEAVFQGIPWWLSLRQGRYKYIRNLLKDEIEELYDPESDPEELRNLAVRREHHELLADFRGRLVAELKRTEAGLLKNLPEPKVVSAPEAK